MLVWPSQSEVLIEADAPFYGKLCFTFYPPPRQRLLRYFLLFTTADDSVSRACQVSQTVRWRFGTFHRRITKPFLLA